MLGNTKVDDGTPNGVASECFSRRLPAGWSRRPKVLDDLVGDAEALKFIVDHLLATGMTAGSTAGSQGVRHDYG